MPFTLPSSLLFGSTEWRGFTECRHVDASLDLLMADGVYLRPLPLNEPFGLGWCNVAAVFDAYASNLSIRLFLREQPKTKQQDGTGYWCGAQSD